MDRNRLFNCLATALVLLMGAAAVYEGARMEPAEANADPELVRTAEASGTNVSDAPLSVAPFAVSDVSLGPPSDMGDGDFNGELTSNGGATTVDDLVDDLPSFDTAYESVDEGELAGPQLGALSPTAVALDEPGLPILPTRPTPGVVGDPLSTAERSDSTTGAASGAGTPRIQPRGTYAVARQDNTVLNRIDAHLDDAELDGDVQTLPPLALALPRITVPILAQAGGNGDSLPEPTFPAIDLPAPTLEPGVGGQDSHVFETIPLPVSPIPGPKSPRRAERNSSDVPPALDPAPMSEQMPPVVTEDASRKRPDAESTPWGGEVVFGADPSPRAVDPVEVLNHGYGAEEFVPESFGGAYADMVPAVVPQEMTYGSSGPTGNPVLDKYRGRFATLAEHEPVFSEGASVAELPGDINVWWSNSVARPLRRAADRLPVDVGSLVLTALEHSPDVLAMQVEPEIRRTGLMEEDAVFDWTAFAETTYDDISDPVGNTLTTGGPDRLRDRNWKGQFGVRRTNRNGGEFELANENGWQRSNSRFFIPNNQGTSRVTLSYTQPLLLGGGRAYNQSRTVLARLDTGAASDDVASRLQDHLMEVSEAYWDLYRSRALYLQRRKLLSEAEAILRTLEGRSAVDALPRQVLRARSAVSSRRSEIARAEMGVRNAESKLRLLVGDPRLTTGTSVELLPAEAPLVARVPLSMADCARTALAHRPDIRQAVKEIRSTGVQVGMASHELLPKLDVVFNSYVSGLEDRSQIATSFGNAFTDGRPSFAGGLLFEVPIGRRAAKARHNRRKLELVKATHELEATVEAGLTEVELAVREAETSHQEVVSKYVSMQAAADETSYLKDRWRILPGNDRATAILLEDLLDAQVRLADDEASFVTAQINYLLALAHLRRATGTLLQFHQNGNSRSPLAVAESEQTSPAN